MVSGAANACNQPGGEIGSLADDGALLRNAGADDLTDNDKPRRDTDPRLQTHPVRAPNRADVRRDGESGTDGAFGRIFEGARKPKVGEDAVAHELGDEAAEPADRTSTDILKTPYQRAQKLGVYAAGQRRGADQVAKQNRDLAAFGRSFGLGWQGFSVPLAQSCRLDLDEFLVNLSHCIVFPPNSAGPRPSAVVARDLMC
jgi:hypothetical protein